MESYTYYKLVMVNVRHAAIKIVDLVDEGVIKEEAMSNVDVKSIDQLLHP